MGKDGFITGSFQWPFVAVNDLLAGSELLAVAILVEAAEQRQSVAHGESRGFEVWLRKAPAGATEEWVSHAFCRCSAACSVFLIHPTALAVGYSLTQLRC